MNSTKLRQIIYRWRQKFGQGDTWSSLNLSLADALSGVQGKGGTDRRSSSMYIRTRSLNGSANFRRIRLQAHAGWFGYDGARIQLHFLGDNMHIRRFSF
jgi:hypothetical protein